MHVSSESEERQHPSRFVQINGQLYSNTPESCLRIDRQLRPSFVHNYIILLGMDIEPVLELIGRWLRPRLLLRLAPARGRGRQPRLFALCLAEVGMITVCADMCCSPFDSV